MECWVFFIVYLKKICLKWFYFLRFVIKNINSQSWCTDHSSRYKEGPLVHSRQVVSGSDLYKYNVNMTKKILTNWQFCHFMFLLFFRFTRLIFLQILVFLKPIKTSLTSCCVDFPLDSSVFVCLQVLSVQEGTKFFDLMWILNLGQTGHCAVFVFWTLISDDVFIWSSSWSLCSDDRMQFSSSQPDLVAGGWEALLLIGPADGQVSFSQPTRPEHMLLGSQMVGTPGASQVSHTLRYVCSSVSVCGCQNLLYSLLYFIFC